MITRIIANGAPYTEGYGEAARRLEEISELPRGKIKIITTDYEVKVEKRFVYSPGYYWFPDPYTYFAHVGGEHKKKVTPREIYLDQYKNVHEKWQEELTGGDVIFLYRKQRTGPIECETWLERVMVRSGQAEQGVLRLIAELKEKALPRDY